MDAVAAIGEKAPEFELEDLEENPHSLERARGKVVVLSFWSAECPWSRKADEYIAERGFEEGWGSEVLHWRIASNANESKEELAAAAAERVVEPVLVDSEQRVADLYGAKTTPHVYVIDAGGILRYAGAMNDATWREPEPTRDYLDEAVRAARSASSPDPAKTPARGCTIVRHQTG